MLLNEKLSGYRLILASHSPRRRQLLAGCDLKFELAESYEVEEIYPHDLPADEVPLYLAGLKSKGCPAQLGERDILLTADTVVIVGGEILGKPSDADDAVRMRAASHSVRWTRRRSGIMSNITARWTRPEATVFRSGSAMWVSRASRVRSTM